MDRVRIMLLVALLCACRHAAAQSAAATDPNPYATADRIFEDFVLEAHLPGLVYGIVVDGHLVHVASYGVQELDTRRPVTADTLFRIASMTKAFTALSVLKLRDEGKLGLDSPAEDYVPQLRAWQYPTADSPKIRVRDLLSHTAGLVTDDPWGDRQTPLPEEEFTRLLAAGVPFSHAPAMAYEYSNLGYALLGRVITNTTHQPYAKRIEMTLLKPLGMDASGFIADAAPRERRAFGYRWEDGDWRAEPTLGPGAFGAMGGLQTSANDYAKWVAFLLSAWPARDGAEAGPVRRATVRELAQGLNFPRLRTRFTHSGNAPCRQAANYAMGFNVAADCDLGLTLSHGGGYPGFGSHVLLLPERGVGIFAFANRTYAGPSAPTWDAALALDREGVLPRPRANAVSADLARAYRVSGAVYSAGSLAPAQDELAMNFLLDRDAQGWSHDLARLHTEVGDCDTTSPVVASGALTGTFEWRCVRGRVHGSLELAPTRPARLQELVLTAAAP